MHTEPATLGTEFLKPALDAIDAAHARCRELSAKLETLARPDLVEAVLAFVASKDELRALHAEMPGDFDTTSPEWQRKWSDACERNARAQTHVIALGRLIRDGRAERATAAE